MKRDLAKEIFLGIDPGRQKAGVAIVRGDGALLCNQVVSLEEFADKIKALKGVYNFQQIVLGNGTASDFFLKVLKELGFAKGITVADEYGTTEAARREYWQIYPPKGWRRLIPLGLQVPPRPIDDIAALVLVKRFLAKEQKKKDE